MATIVFYTHDKRMNLDGFEYYKQDIDALRTLGHQVVVCTRYTEIPAVFDAMFIWWWTRALVPVLLCRILRRPCIITGTFNFRFPEGFRGQDYFRRPYWQKLLIKLAVKHCSLNLFVSQLELEQCSKYFHLNNAAYFPHCLSDEYLKGPAVARHKAVLNVSWSGKDNLIRKGIPELLEAIRLLKERGQSVEVCLAGLEGDGKRYLLDTIRQLGIGAQVRYLGALPKEEKIKQLRECELYVQPSQYEGFGLATLEAMGCGACVIVRDVGAVREVVGDCGLYVSSVSPAELAAAIERVLNDSALRQSLQTKAFERARNLFAFEKKVEGLGQCLHQLGVYVAGSHATNADFNGDVLEAKYMSKESGK